MVAQVTSLWMPPLRFRPLLYLPADFRSHTRNKAHYFPVLMNETGKTDTKPPTTVPDDNP
jgi:hypothetical protein